MSNENYKMEKPQNEPVLEYKPGSKERELVDVELNRIYNEQIEIPLIIGGKEVKTGSTSKVVMPTEHNHILATYHKAGEKEIAMAIEAALEAKKIWESLDWKDRAAIMLKAAELISTKYRYILNAATMLNQGKNVYQAEIDSTCETIDFLRFNAYYMSKIYENQPSSSKGILNKMEYRALEGFIFAITPFNFTAIAANLTTAPVMLGNVAVWKPASTAILSGYYLMKLFKEAGLPDGVINFIPGSGAIVGNIVMKHKDLAGIHFTGSTKTFISIWKTISENLDIYKSYPRLVGETGGKDFIIAHPSSNPKEVAVALMRGSFEYQGQKCSAASRAYIPNNLWDEIKAYVGDMLGEIKMGDVRNYKNFFNAVIDEKSYDNIMNYIDDAKKDNSSEVLFGGNGDKSKGYFVEPTIILTTNPKSKAMKEEIFGPVMTIYVYEEDKFEEALHLCDETSPYALTGAIFSQDRTAIDKANEILRHAAGNFYINDKPTGAVVDQQPFGGARKSGTNDKAGSHLNLLRWVSSRTVKETLIPATDFKYPFME